MTKELICLAIKQGYVCRESCERVFNYLISIIKMARETTPAHSRNASSEELHLLEDKLGNLKLQTLIC